VIDPGRPVRVFRNWKRGCYNIRQGRFVVSAREVCLGDVEFLVRQSGRQRMLESGRKNVHAYAVGNLLDFVLVTEPCRLLDRASMGRALHYNPLISDRFVDSQTLAPLNGVDRAYFLEKGATYTQRDGDIEAVLQALSKAA